MGLKERHFPSRARSAGTLIETGMTVVCGPGSGAQTDENLGHKQRGRRSETPLHKDLEIWLTEMLESGI